MNFVTVKELSEFLKVKQSTLYSWVHSGTVPYYKLNGLLRFDMDDVMEWVKSSKASPPKADIPVKKTSNLDIDSIVKRAVESTRKGSYNPPKRETSPESRPRKGGSDGTV